MPTILSYPPYLGIWIPQLEIALLLHSYLAYAKLLFSLKRDSCYALNR